MKHDDAGRLYSYAPYNSREDIEAAIAHYKHMIEVMYRTSLPGSVVRVTGIERANQELRLLYRALDALDAQSECD